MSSKRTAAYIVVLHEDLHEDVAADTLTALRMIQGVVSVEPVSGDDPALTIARSRIDAEWQHRLLSMVTGPRRNESRRGQTS